eukprot:COSAG01_NODE_1887_length_8982_cov_15.771474_4_plen_441_part_00
MSDYVGDDVEWARHLGRLLDVESLAPSALEAVRPMAALGLIDDLGRVERMLRDRRAPMRAILRAQGCAEFNVEFALAIWLYTLENPAVYRALNGAMHAPERLSAGGAVSENLRAVLPLAKLLQTALENAPDKFRYYGRCHRGVKFAFTAGGKAASVHDHEPAAYYPVGRQFHWFEFKSASIEHDTMYTDAFCGDRGPRTIFEIEGVRGVLVEAFSAVGSEKEVLFPPLSRFEVAHVQKKLRSQDLRASAAAGGFPDEVRLVKPRVILKGLQLKPGAEQFDAGPPLGSGSFADVFRGTYPLPGQGETQLAFKLFKNSQALTPALRKQIELEALLGMRLDHPNLIKLFGVLQVHGRGLALVLELAEGGSLRAVLSDVASYPQLDWELRLRWAIGITEGVAKLHSLSPQPIVHRDLKAVRAVNAPPLPSFFSPSYRVVKLNGR